MPRLFQYQAAARPLSTSPETTTADRWQGNDGHVPRRLAAPAWLLGVTMVAPLVVPEVTARPDKWAAAPAMAPPPPRLLAAQIPTYAAPVGAAAPATPTVASWQGSQSLPPRQKKLYLRGTVQAVSVHTATAPVESWMGQSPIPVRPRHPAQLGYCVLPVSTAKETVFVDKWAGSVSLPQFRKAPARFDAPFLAPVAASPAPPVSSWYVELSRPPRATPLPVGAAESQNLRMPIAPPPLAPSISAWKGSYPDTVPARPRPVDYGWFAWPAQTPSPIIGAVQFYDATGYGGFAGIPFDSAYGIRPFGWNQSFHAEPPAVDGFGNPIPDDGVIDTVCGEFPSGVPIGDDTEFYLLGYGGESSDDVIAQAGYKAHIYDRIRANGRQAGPWTGFPGNANGFGIDALDVPAWQARNNLVATVLDGHFDFVAWQAYAGSADQAVWQKTHVQQIYPEARRIANGKPVYAIVLPFLNIDPNDPSKNLPLGVDFWQYQLTQLIAAGVDGIILWAGYGVGQGEPNKGAWDSPYWWPAVAALAQGQSISSGRFVGFTDADNASRFFLFSVNA